MPVIPAFKWWRQQDQELSHPWLQTEFKISLDTCKHKINLLKFDKFHESTLLCYESSEIQMIRC
jgi:hypothetical protein